MGMTREERLERRKQWRAANKEKLRIQAQTPEAKERAKRWRSENPEKCIGYQRRWHARNLEQVNKSHEAYRKSPKYRAFYKRYTPDYCADPANRMRRLVNSAFIRAIKSDREFDQCIKEIFTANPPTHCASCGINFDYSSFKGRSKQSPSLDRLDNDGGYTVENTFAICWGCNEAKKDHSLERLEAIVAYMRKNMVAKEVLT